MVAEMRDICLGSFKAFCILAFQHTYQKRFIWADHHNEILKALMRVWAGLDQNLIINIPPRYSKTEMMCLFAAWAYAHNPRCEFLHLSYSAKLATKNSDKVRTLMRSRWYQDCFGVELNSDIDSKGEWATKEGGIFKADSSGGQVTGFGAGATDEFDEDGNFVFSGCLLIDDPLKPSDAHTVEREKVNENWEETLKSRRNSPATTPTICIMQRLHEGDFTAELLADVAQGFKQLVMKALRDDGTALWPLKHSADALAQMRDKNIYVFSGQYQQQPTPKGGTIFRAEWWQMCYELPEFESVIITADTALKAKEHNDYSVFQTWGKAKGKAYFIEQIRGKWESPDLLRVATAYIARTKERYSQLHTVNIEDKASGTGLIQSLARNGLCTVNAIQRNVDKVTRAYDAAPHVQSGEVVLLEGAPHNGIFIAECTSFNAELTHLHDDQVDPMMDAIDILLDKPQSYSGILIC
jgi:predicted phage terminase large subunit-like protein